eukprot:1005761-Pyramimonas_sp.AAC.2
MPMAMPQCPSVSLRIATAYCSSSKLSEDSVSLSAYPKVPMFSVPSTVSSCVERPFVIRQRMETTGQRVCSTFRKIASTNPVNPMKMMQLSACTSRSMQGSTPSPTKLGSRVKRVLNVILTAR